MLKIEKTEFSGWKNCYKVINGNAEIIVTADMGPRILSLTCCDKANHMKVFEDTAGKIGGKEGFTAYGGHRVWHAPEMEVRTCFSDNFPCEVEITKDKLVVYSPIEKETNLQRGFIITACGKGFNVCERITNKGWFPVEFSTWGLSQFAHGGMLIVPNSTVNSGLVSNRVISMWPYSSMNDSRVMWGDRYVFVEPDTKHSNAFKFGSSVVDGFAAYFNHNQLFIKKFPYEENGNYPNYHCNFESYTNGEFIEIEALTPLKVIDRNESYDLNEQWFIFDNINKPDRGDEKAVTDAINKCSCLAEE